MSLFLISRLANSRVTRALAFSSMLCALHLPAYGQEVCIQQYYERKGDELSFSPSEVHELVERINDAFDLPGDTGVIIVPCPSENRVVAHYYPDDKRVRQGEYILYDPDWVQEVTGGDTTDLDKAEGIFIFAHELGHYLGKHFTTHRNMTRYDKELQADGFAACASAKLQVSWTSVRAAIGRFRRSQGRGDYPSRAESREYSEQEYDKCVEEIMVQGPEEGKDESAALTEDSTAESTTQQNLFPSGTLMQGCGCWGPNLMPVPEERCEMGFVQPVQCPGFCPMGGFPYSYSCQ